MSDPPDLREPSPSVRVQILATEHWSLLATRSQTWAEVMARITAQFTFASASLLVLALAVQVIGLGQTFRLMALWLGVSVLLTGTLTVLRVLDASAEDLRLVEGMNRLRAAYVELDPGVKSYLVTGWTSDAAGFEQTYVMGLRRSWRRRLLASAFMFTITVNVVVAVGLGAVLGAIAGGHDVVPVLTGLAGAAVYVGVVFVPAQRSYAELHDGDTTVRRAGA